MNKKEAYLKVVEESIKKIKVANDINVLNEVYFRILTLLEKHAAC